MIKIKVVKPEPVPDKLVAVEYCCENMKLALEDGAFALPEFTGQDYLVGRLGKGLRYFNYCHGCGRRIIQPLVVVA